MLSSCPGRASCGAQQFSTDVHGSSRAPLRKRKCARATAKPWSRKTHKYFPTPARERAAELLRVGQWFKRLPNDFPIPFEVWEVFVMPHMVTRDYRPPQA